MSSVAYQLFFLEGNIGSGKSTFLAHLKAHLTHPCFNLVFLDEPVAEWDTIRDDSDISILAKFYADQTKYAFSFQMMAYISRLVQLKKAIDAAVADFERFTIIISERSLQTDRYVFAKMLYDSGKLESVEYQIYLKWFDYFTQQIRSSVTFYIKTDPVVCMQRIKIRSRTGEEIPLEYLAECHQYHEEMIRHLPHHVVEVDGNNELTVFDEWLSILKKKVVGGYDTNTEGL